MTFDVITEATWICRHCGAQKTYRGTARRSRPPQTELSMCNRVLAGRRADATWCSARCRMRWKRKQKSLQQARAGYSAVHPDVNLTDLHQRAGRPDYWADIEAGQVDDGLPEFSDDGIYERDDHQDDDYGIVYVGPRARRPTSSAQ